MIRLVRSQAVGPVVISSVEVEDAVYEVHHFDLPPDETGIFSAAMAMRDAPPAEEQPGETHPKGSIEETAKPKPILASKEKLEAAQAVAAELNKLNGMLLEVERSGDGLPIEGLSEARRR